MAKDLSHLPGTGGGQPPQGAGHHQPPPITRYHSDGRPASDRNVILPLEVRQVDLILNRTHLIHELDFRVEAGRRTVILGPNGAGKSLTMRLCHGLIPPSRGRIDWRGPLGGNPQQVRRHQAMVFQKPVHLRRSVRENVAFILRKRGFGGEDLRARIDSALHRARLEHLAARPARALSMGEQQRLALARVWVMKPSILFLDEPTASLDPAATKDVEALILALHQASTTIFFASHDIGQAQRIADDVIFMSGGRILEQCPADMFFDRPATREGRAYIAGELLA